MNPPSVEGWHTGTEWIDTGILVERINFAAVAGRRYQEAGHPPAHRAATGRGDLSPEELVDGCLDLIGPLRVSERTRDTLLGLRRAGGAARLATRTRPPTQRVGEMLQVIVATREFQFA